MGNRGTKSSEDRAVLVHGTATSDVDQVNTLFNNKMPWSTRKSSVLNFVQEPGAVLFEEYRYSGRGGVHLIKDGDGVRKRQQSVKAIVLVLDGSDLDAAFTLLVKDLPHVPEDAYWSWHQSASMRDRSDWLLTMMNQRVDLLFDRPVLVLVNKCEDPKAVTAEEVRDRLLSKHLTRFNIRVQECSTQCGVGLEEGWKWLVEQVTLFDKLKLANKNGDAKKTNHFLLPKSFAKGKAKAEELKKQLSKGLTIGKIDREKLQANSNVKIAESADTNTSVDTAPTTTDLVEEDTVTLHYDNSPSTPEISKTSKSVDMSKETSVSTSPAQSLTASVAAVIAKVAVLV